jgi:hypothetical protein
MRDGFLFARGREPKPKVRDVCTFQAVENGADVDEGSDLLPPVGAANQPPEKGREDLRAVSAQ